MLLVTENRQPRTDYASSTLVILSEASPRRRVEEPAPSEAEGSNAALIKLAYAFEQATHHRKPPQFAPPPI
jgi:hypothetical protein